MSQYNFQILCIEDQNQTPTRSGIKDLIKQVTSTKTISSNDMKENISGFVSNISEALDISLENNMNFMVDEIEFTLGMGLEGQLSFLGNGVKADTNGSVKIKFKYVGK